MEDEIRQGLEHLVRFEVERVPQILIVNDNDDMRRALAEALGEKSKRVYHVQTAEGGPSALEMLQRHRFDVVVSNIYMSGMNGIELLGKIKEKYSDTEVIMLTAHPNMMDVTEAMRLGAFECFSQMDLSSEILLGGVSLAIQRQYARLEAILGLKEVQRYELPSPQYSVSILSRLLRSELVQTLSRKTLSHLHHLLGTYMLEAQNKSEARRTFEESVRVYPNRDSLIKLTRLITPAQCEASSEIYSRLIGDNPTPVGAETFQSLAADIHAKVIGNRANYDTMRGILFLPSSYPDSVRYDVSADLSTIVDRVNRDVKAAINRIFESATIQRSEQGRYIRVKATFGGFANDGRVATVEYEFDTKTGYTQLFAPDFRAKPAAMTGKREQCPLCNYFLPVQNESIVVYDGVWGKGIFNLFPKSVGHIVVIEDEEHHEWQNLSIGSLVENNIVFAAASKALRENPDIRYTSFYKNRGFFADASFESHPHGHIVGVPVPSDVLNRGPYKAGEIIYSTQDFYVALPEIGHDFQVMVFPKSKSNYLHEFSIEQLIQLAAIENRISQVYRRHGVTDWNLRILESAQGMIIEYVPRIKAGGGLEHEANIRTRKYTPHESLRIFRS